MGLGRDDMKKMFVDDIKKRGDHSMPGPGRYFKEGSEKRFGDDEMMVLKQFSQPQKYSMGKKLLTGEAALDRSKRLPGPGFYTHTEVTGQALV